jgi:hypothetical protein
MSLHNNLHCSLIQSEIKSEKLFEDQASKFGYMRFDVRLKLCLEHDVFSELSSVYVIEECK